MHEISDSEDTVIVSLLRVCVSVTKDGAQLLHIKQAAGRRTGEMRLYVVTLFTIHMKKVNQNTYFEIEA